MSAYGWVLMMMGIATCATTQTTSFYLLHLSQERLEAQLLIPVPKTMPHNGTSSFKGVTKLGYVDSYGHY